MAKKTLTLFLGKADIDEFEQVFTEEASARIGNPSTRVVDAPGFGGGARLYVFVGQQSTPGWLIDLRRVFSVTGQITTGSAAAVLVFRSAGRCFASSFAHGWMYLDERRFEGDFGLRAAINGLDDTKLKRLERANLGDALRAVSLSPYQRGLTSFGLDDALDLIRKISGRTRDTADEGSPDAMTGSRSLRVTGEFGIVDLPKIAEKALGYYESTTYRDTQFAILDFVMPIADKHLSDTLDCLAAASIRGGLVEFELGLPIGFADEAVSYRFEGPRFRGSHPDLLLRHYVAAIGNRLPDLTPQTLRDHKITAIFDDDSRPNAKWSIRTGLVGSLLFEDERYATNEGEWYRIEQQFKDAIEAAFEALVEVWEVPPEPLRKIYHDHGEGRFETEAAYNSRFAQSHGYVLLDRALIQIPGVDRSDFETCDILDILGKRFIHLKKSSRRSSVLSHFFKQGTNSARHFSTFAAAWTKLREVVVARAGSEAGDQLDAMRSNEQKWKVEFVIADTPRADGRFNIPFFSKVSLRDEVRTINAMQYSAGLRFINLQPNL